MIAITDLHKKYGGSGRSTRALDGVDLEIDAGEFVAIVGTSGSGKTTLLNIVGGLDTDYDGEVVVEGRELRELSEADIARMRNERFGFVFQQFHLLDHLTVRENVEMPGYFADSAQQAQPTAETLLDRVGLAHKAEDHPNQLSGGQQQRVAIARALYRRPENLLCDEPTGNLDRKTGLQVMELFQQLNREFGITLIMVTHEEYIARMARRIVRLEDGKVRSDEPNEPNQPSQASIVATKGAVADTTEEDT